MRRQSCTALPAIASPAIILALLLAGPAAAGPLGGGDRDPLQMLKAADADRDGRITAAEFTAARAQMFARLDRNGDGYATAEDLPRRAARRGGGERMAALRGQLDSDGDGRVSRHEFVEGPGAFDRIDANGDGAVSADELARAEQVLAQRRSQTR